MKVNSVFATKSGTTPRTTVEEYYKDGDIPWVNSSELSSGIIETFSNYVTEKALEETSLQIIPSQSTLVALYGATVGEVGFLSAPATINQAVCAIMPNRDVSDPLYVFYYFKSIGRMLRNRATGSARSNISQTLIKDLDIDLPDKSLQARISSLLHNLDKNIIANNKINSQLEEIIDLVYNYWFVQFDFPDENGRPYKSSGGKMIYSPELGYDIPDGWEVLTLKDKLKFKRGTEVGSKAYSSIKESDNYVKFYRVRDVDTDSSTWVDSSSHKIRILKPGDVAVTFDGTVGRIGININGAISSGIRHVFDKDGDISASVVWPIFRSSSIQEILRQYVASRGSILAHAGGAIDSLRTPYDAEIYGEYAKIADPIYKLIVNNLQENQQLASLRDWLLPMLMNGQVVVKSKGDDQ